MTAPDKLYEEILLETSPNRLAGRIASIYAEAWWSLRRSRTSVKRSAKN